MGYRFVSSSALKRANTYKGVPSAKFKWIFIQARTKLRLYLQTRLGDARWRRVSESPVRQRNSARRGCNYEMKRDAIPISDATSSGDYASLSITMFTHRLHRIFSRWSRRDQGPVYPRVTWTVAIIVAGAIRAMIPHCSTAAINVNRSRSSGRDGYALLSSARVPFAASFVGSIAVENGRSVRAFEL